MRRVFRRVWFWSGGLLCLAGLIGCGSSGPERAAIHGRVTFNGEPLEKGVIVFAPTGDKGGPTAGGEISNGEFTIPLKDGPVVGTNRVEITAMKSDDSKEPAAGIAGAASGPSGAGSAPPLVQIIPKQYNKESNLTFDVEPKENTYEVDLDATP